MTGTWGGVRSDPDPPTWAGRGGVEPKAEKGYCVCCVLGRICVFKVLFCVVCVRRQHQDYVRAFVPAKNGVYLVPASGLVT